MMTKYLLLTVSVLFLSFIETKHDNSCRFFISIDGLTYTLEPYLHIESNDSFLYYKLSIQNSSKNVVCIPKTSRVFTVGPNLFTSIGFYSLSTQPPSLEIMMELERLEPGQSHSRVISSSVKGLSAIPSGTLSIDYLIESDVKKIAGRRPVTNLMSLAYLKYARHITQRYLPCVE